MFQNLVSLTEFYPGRTNDAASAGKFLATRTAELRVEIEASAPGDAVAQCGFAANRLMAFPVKYFR